MIGCFLSEREEQVFRSHHILLVFSIFYLMTTCNDGNLMTDLHRGAEKDVVSHNLHSVIVWGLHKELTTLEMRAKFVDMGWESFISGSVLWE